MFNTISFKIKLYASIFFTVIIPTILVVSILYRRMAYEITSQISAVVANSLNFTSAYVETSLDVVKRNTMLLLNEDPILAAAHSNPPLTDREIINTNINTRKVFYDYIQRIIMNNSPFGFDSFYIYLPAHNLLMDSKTTYYENVIPENIDFLKKDPGHDWFITRAVDFYTLNGIDNWYGGPDFLLSFSDEIRDRDGRVLLAAAANVHVGFLGGYYGQVEKGIPGNFMILDENGDLIADSAPALKQGENVYPRIFSAIRNTGKPFGNFEVSADRQKYLAVYSTSYNSGWNYVVLIPTVEIFRQIYSIQRFFILLIVIITILVIPVCFLITGTLYKPLEKLVLAMQHVENGNFDTPISDQRKDEYQKVYRGFNLMLGELRRLIEDLSNEKALNKQAEINLIQAQINPHFLYNTLDSIYSIATICKVDEISKMAAALSKFFRVSLSGGKTNTSLKEALDIVKSYVTIQNIRFNNKIVYRVSIPDEYLGITVPKLILQPLVENSIYHGLEKKKGKGRLTIDCVREGGILRIHVTDNGAGMTEEQLAALRESIYDDAENSQNFALKILNRQLMLKYGKEYGLRIESRAGEGTMAVISLPVPSTGKKAE